MPETGARWETFGRGLGGVGDPRRGMNFHVMPELTWTFGYTGFWLVVTFIVAGLTLYMKKQGWL